MPTTIYDDEWAWKQLDLRKAAHLVGEARSSSIAAAQQPMKTRDSAVRMLAQHQEPTTYHLVELCEGYVSTLAKLVYRSLGTHV